MTSGLIMEKFEKCPNCGNSDPTSWLYDFQECISCGYSGIKFRKDLEMAGSPELNKPARSRLEAAYDICPELRGAVEALERISSPSQSERLLWWQAEARVALAKLDKLK